MPREGGLCCEWLRPSAREEDVFKWLNDLVNSITMEMRRGLHSRVNRTMMKINWISSSRGGYRRERKMKRKYWMGTRLVIVIGLRRLVRGNVCWGTRRNYLVRTSIPIRRGRDIELILLLYCSLDVKH